METTTNFPRIHRRFNVLHRLLHIIIIANFTLLAITGFGLHFSGYGWARLLVSILGGPQAAGFLHRFCAVFLYSGIGVHLCWLLYFKLVLNGSLLGPGSLVPGKKDAADLYQNLRYVFGKGRPPLFERFSYLQKVDYWAVMLGMQSMGITGLFMWFPEYFSTVFPGHWVNIASHFHFHEAVLAVMYIGVVHMSDTHLVPEVFPIEKSIFTGTMSEERFREEHPEEWKRMNPAKD
ncbi:MAG: cytochrome b/b6 domain-containing protein [Pseudomonadota bacterium]